MRRVAVVMATVGCRFGFEQPGDGKDATAVTTDAAADARPDAPANALTYVFGERPTATHSGVTSDTYISQDMETVDDRVNNFGGEDKLKVKYGEDHGLVRFDLSAIPAGATIVYADLEMVVISAAPSSIVAVHALSESWLENTLEGTAGTSNWTMRDPVNAWTTVGAAPPGSAGPMLATFSVATLGGVTVEVPRTTVQAWVDSPATNHGMLLLETTDNNNPDLASRETSTSQAPQLTVTFVP